MSKSATTLLDQSSDDNPEKIMENWDKHMIGQSDEEDEESNLLTLINEHSNKSNCTHKDLELNDITININNSSNTPSN